MRGEVTVAVGEIPDWDQPGDVVWVPDAPYLAAWREARDATDDLCAALDDAGVDRGEVLAVPSTDTKGEPVVRLAGQVSPAQVRHVAHLLRRGAGAGPERASGLC